VVIEALVGTNVNEEKWKFKEEGISGRGFRLHRSIEVRYVEFFYFLGGRDLELWNRLSAFGFSYFDVIFTYLGK